MPNKSKTIVTGGAGFIGSHLVKKLIDSRRKVIVVDDFSSGKMENFFNLGIKKSQLKIRKVDLTNFEQAFNALRDGDTIFHLAARIGGIRYLHGDFSAELAALEENLAIDANVFRSCLAHKIQKIIYSSTAAVYPTDNQYKFGTFFSESNLTTRLTNRNPALKHKISLNPDGGYGLSKTIGEIQLNWMKGPSVGIARIFNVYGINEPFGEKAHAIFDLSRKAIRYPKEKFVVWGDGLQNRDYIYVTDCVDALIKLERKISGGQVLTLNIGSGRPTSIKKIAEIIIKLSGKKIKPIFDLKKPVGYISRTARIKKAKNTLGWKPRVAMDEGLERTYRWIERKI